MTRLLTWLPDKVRKFKAAMGSGDLDAMFDYLAEDVLIIEHGPKHPDLPFLGIEFRGHDGMKEYIDALSKSLEIIQWDYAELIVHSNDQEAGGLVYVRGIGKFASKKTGKNWEETFVSRYEMDREGNITKYETWADPLSAYLAVQP